MTWLLRLLAIAAAFLLTACYQEERTYTLNPDGSGKVVFEFTMPLDAAISFGNDDRKMPEEKLKDAARDILEESEGVSAWADVSFELTDDEKIDFKGTAYFNDLNQLKLKMGSVSSSLLTPGLTRDGDVVTLTCSQSQDEEGDEDEQKKGKEWDKMTAEEQEAEVAKAKQQLLQMKAMAAGMMGDMTSKATFHLPRKPSKNQNFEALSETSYAVETSGAKMMAAFDKLIEDEELLRSAAGNGLEMQGDPPEEIFEAMFGRPGNPTLTFSGAGEAAFDYKSEVKAAQEAAPAMLEKLGLKIIPPAPISGEGKFESLRLAGLRIVTPSPDNNVRPFNWSEGISLAFIAKLPGAVISADDGKVTTFTLENGQNLLPKKDWDREIRSVDLSEDGATVGFEVSSDQLPDAGVSMIKELAGELVFMAAEGSERTDLGFKKLAVDEAGEHFGAKIEKLGDHSFHEDKKEVSIRFEFKRSMVKDVHFIDADGLRLESQRNGHFWSGDGGTMTFTVDKALDEACRVEVETFTGITKHVIPFKVENIPLMPLPSDGE
ncbi:hypothetical protein [Haloferula rosea]|uniref:Lipoprotein n=1 Tax=Haloferula rosea TaxID=490093 RepID=A0A934RCQ4_9BACT|nr:hypothetical protein [Haloferula rosea]MBK1828742.1 hypothetical protein [Haloferula rosea]